MKRYTKNAKVVASTYYPEELAEKASDAIWDFQNAITGDPRLSSNLTEEDILTLDRAREILDLYQ